MIIRVFGSKLPERLQKRYEYRDILKIVENNKVDQFLALDSGLVNFKINLLAKLHPFLN